MPPPMKIMDLYMLIKNIIARVLVAGAMMYSGKAAAGTPGNSCGMPTVFGAAGFCNSLITGESYPALDTKYAITFNHLTNSGYVDVRAASGELQRGLIVAGDNGNGAHLRGGTNPGDKGQIAYWTGAAYMSAFEVESVNTLDKSTATIMLSGGQLNIGAYRTGIGTTSPTERLHVSGNILGTSSVTASGFFGDGSGLTNLFQIQIATQAAGANGAATTVSCPAGKKAYSGGCTCTGATSVASINMRPDPLLVAGTTQATGWLCKMGSGATGGACAAFVNCWSVGL